jgi:probable rRNA maturation factor
MSAIVDIQHASNADHIPLDEQFTHWVNSALQHPSVHAVHEIAQHTELSIRIVDAVESQQLNRDYRQQDKPTNVLSFPAEIPDFVDTPLLGDLVICAPIVATEAQQQHKTTQAHWAHMTIHGTLHLLGYDHIDDDDAELMEALEVKLLAALGFSSPYEMNTPYTTNS